jgi:hypothetical protein
LAPPDSGRLPFDSTPSVVARLRPDYRRFNS